MFEKFTKTNYKSIVNFNDIYHYKNNTPKNMDIQKDLFKIEKPNYVLNGLSLGLGFGIIKFIFSLYVITHLGQIYHFMFNSLDKTTQ